MSVKNRKRRLQSIEPIPSGNPARRYWWLYPFALGSVFTGVIVFAVTYKSVKMALAQPSPSMKIQEASAHLRTVAQLLTLTDTELEKVDVVELNLAVARETPGWEKLDIEKYQRIVSEWAAQIARDLPRNEQVFHQTPEKWDSDIHLFRLGQVAGYLDRQCGIAYIEEQKHAEEIRYTNLGDLFLHGLIDTKQGTCGNMSALHVAIGRRLGWPVSLASVASHTVCRFDDGKVVHNLEATDTGRGGFAVSSDKEYAEKFGTSQIAIDRGSELTSLTAREMLGYFIALRARHYADIGEMGRADVDYALARSIIPNHRRTYMGAVEAAISKGNWLFARGEMGHPISLAHAINGEFGDFRAGPTAISSAAHNHTALDDPIYYARKHRREQERALRQSQSAVPSPTMQQRIDAFGAIRHAVGYPPSIPYGPVGPMQPPH